jgi:hypothetical protein
MAVTRLDDSKPMTAVEGSGVVVLLEDVKGDAAGTVPPRLVEEQRPDPEPSGIGEQIQVLKDIPRQSRIADDFVVTHRHPCRASRQDDRTHPLSDLLMGAFGGGRYGIVNSREVTCTWVIAEASPITARLVNAV